VKRLLIPTVWLLLASLCAASEPTPAPKAVLQRVQFSAGTIGFRTTDSHYDRYLWSVSPKEAEASFWAVKLDPSGEPVALCGYAKPYVVVFVAMTDTGGDVAVVRVSGEGPPDPPPDPDDTDTDDPQPNTWARWTQQSVEKHVQLSGRRDHALRFASALEGVCKKSSRYSSARLFREAVRQACHGALAKDPTAEKALTKWSNEKLGPELLKLATAGKLSTIKQYAEVYTGIAQGLRAVDTGQWRAR